MTIERRKLIDTPDVKMQLEQFDEAYKVVIELINSLRIRGIMVKPVLSLEDSQYVYKGYKPEGCSKPKRLGK